MVDKVLLEAAKKKLQAKRAQTPPAPATAEVAPKVDSELLAKAKEKLKTKKASPKSAGSPPSPPLPRLKGDTRPVEPASGVSAVAPVAAVPAPRTSPPVTPPVAAAPEEGLASKGLSALFAGARRLTPMGQIDDLKTVYGLATAGGLTPLERSAQSAKRDFEGGKALVGAPDAHAFVQAQKDLDAIKYDADLQKRIQEYNDAPGFAAGAQYLINNPDVAGSMMKEQLVNAGITTGSSLAGAAAGSVVPGLGTGVGAVTGAFASSAATSAASAVLNYMQDKNIDPTNEEQVQGLFTNPEAMADMRKYAAKYGVAVGALDAFSSLLGIKGAGSALAKPFLQEAENAAARIAGREAAKVAAGPVAEGAANLAIDAAAGGAGEALGGLWSRGKVNINDVRDEVIFGVGAGLGSATIETVISRGEHGGHLPTAEEIAAAGGVEPPPPETLVTPEEATAEGRTLFGFAPHNSTEPVNLGDYNEAERQAGQGDIRRGKIIAVKEDQTSAPVTVEEALQVVDSPNSDHFAELKDRIAKQYGAPGKTAALQLQAAVNKYDTHLADKSVESDVARQELTQKLETIFKPLRAYRGDTKNLGVSPRVANEIAVTDVEDTYAGPAFKSDLNGEINVLQLDKLHEALKAKNWKIVPAAISRIISKDARMGKLLDNTFTFTSPEARQRFIAADLDQRTELFKSGDVAWKGKLDGRFLPSSQYTPSSERAFRVIDEVGNVVATPEVVNTVKPFIAKGLPTKALDQKTMFGNRTSTSSTNDPDLQREFDAVVGTAPGSLATISSTSGFAKFKSVFELWHKKFRIKTPTLFLELRVDAIGKYNWPTELQQKAPELFAKLNSNMNYHGMCWDLMDGRRVVTLVTYDPTHFSYGSRTEADYYGTLTHEFGHVISSEHFAAAPLEVRNKIFSAYRRFILANPLTPQVYEQFKRRRFAESRQANSFAGVQAQASYYLSFEEWFAEQTARWGNTNGRPLGTLGKFFRSIAKQVVELYKSARQQFGKLESRAEFEMDAYLAHMWDGADVLTNWPENAVQYTETLARQQNSKVDPDPLSQHAATANLSAVLKQVTDQPFVPGPQKSLLAAVRAGVDRYNWFYEWALNLRQLAARNPHIQELQLINELFDFAKKDATNVMVEAEGYLKRWRRRSRGQQDALASMLQELDRMEYLQPNEKPRWPTPQEFSDMVTRLGMDADTLALYKDIRDFFLNSVRRQEQLQIQEAMRITDPALQQAAIKSAQDLSRLMISRPYFPQMRFGKWSLTVRQQGGKLEHFELFEHKGDLQTALEAAAQQYPASAGWEVEGSTVPQETQPFMGVPPWMLDKIRQMPGLSPAQQDWLEKFRYMVAPAQSFRKRMLRRKNYKGASVDARRVFANYSFHHARFYSRIKHDFDLRSAIDGLRHSRNPGAAVTEISDRKRMADFAERIYKEFRNPSQDWTQLRVLNALWHLAYVPASAMVNMTQTVLAAAPYLSAKFGGIKGEIALMKAAGQLNSFYKQGSYKSMPGVEFKAISKAVEDGYIDESMAAELAASAVGHGGGFRVGSSLFREKLSTGFQQFSEKGMWMFRMAEQWNRRVSFRAARQLAFDNPHTPWVQDMRIKHFLKYDELVRSGWTDREAISYLAGVEALLETHYSYDRLARPRFMQGKKSVLFAFYMFTQNSLFMLWNNKDMLARYMLYSAIIAGPMGLVPDDAEDVINAIASKLFGKDFNLEREARKFIVDMLGEDSHIPPDLLLHGLSRYTFGLSLAGDVLGAKFVPDIDMSNSLTLNRVLPLNVSSLLQPAADWNERVANATRDAAGAAYGIPLAIGKALVGNDMNIADFKRWEGAMPRAFKQTTRAIRLGYEGADRTASGAKTIPYDLDTPKDFMEVMAVAAGFTPTKQSQYWDEQMAAKEMDLFWSGQKQLLLRDLYQAKFIYQDQDSFKEGIEKIKEFNTRAPQGYAISGKSIKASLMRREKTRQQIESGQNPYVGKGVADEAARLYPEGSTVSVKQVK